MSIREKIDRLFRHVSSCQEAIGRKPFWYETPEHYDRAQTAIKATLEEKKLAYQQEIEACFR